jgi:AraC family transcriptional regulator
MSQQPQLHRPRIEAVQTTRIAFIRHRGPQSTIERTFRKLVDWAGDRGLLRDDTRYIGVAHEDPAATGSSEPRYDCAITVGRDFRPEGEVEVGNIEAGEYAVVTYQGPYWGVDAAYTWLIESWIKEQGRQVRNAPTFEVYLNDASAVPESELLTDVHVPLEWW